MEMNGIDPVAKTKLPTQAAPAEEVEEVAEGEKARAFTGFEAVTFTVNDLALATLVIGRPAAITVPSEPLPELRPAEVVFYFRNPLFGSNRFQTRLDQRRHARRERIRRRHEEILKGARKVKPAAVNLRNDGEGYDHNSLLGRALPFKSQG